MDKIVKALDYIKAMRVTGATYADNENGRNIYSYVYFRGFNGVYYMSAADSKLHYHKGTIPQGLTEQDTVKLLSESPVLEATPYKAEQKNNVGYMRSMYNIYLINNNGFSFHWGVPAHQLVLYLLQEGAIEIKLKSKEGEDCLEINHMQSNMSNINRSLFDKCCAQFSRIQHMRNIDPQVFNTLVRSANMGTVEPFISYTIGNKTMPDGKEWGFDANSTKLLLKLTNNLKHKPAFPRDNRIENLELCTRSQNLDHARLIRTFDRLANIAFSAKTAEIILNQIRDNALLSVLLEKADGAPKSMLDTL